MAANEIKGSFIVIVVLLTVVVVPETVKLPLMVTFPPRVGFVGIPMVTVAPSEPLPDISISLAVPAIAAT